MNAQNNDSSSPDILPSSQNVGQVPSASTGAHSGILDTIAHLFHKKSPEIVQKSVTPSATISPEIDTATVAQPVTPPSSPGASSETSSQQPISISDQIAGLFHKKSPEESSSTAPAQVPEIVEQQLPPQSPAQNVDPPHIIHLETPATDERFARLLAEDSVYQSMIRSQDVKNIRLQLAMRYMLLMLAIFVVIAWVVNNRVIMFGFYDFPILSRIRDILFGVLTGLFCLTIWFGSTAWINNKIGILILRGLALTVFMVVIVSIYLPFWR